MSHARPDSTTVSAASAAPRTRGAPSRIDRSPDQPGGERPAAGRRIGVDPSKVPPPPPREIAGSRRQVVLVAHVFDASSVPAEVFGRAVVDVHEVSEAFGGETIAVLGHQVVAAFPFDQAADAVTAAVEIQRDAVRSAAGEHRWSCAVSLVAGDVIDHPAFERIGVQPVAAIVDRALQLSGLAGPGTVVVDEGTALPAAKPRPEVVRGAGEAPDASDPDAIASSPVWTLGPNRLLLDEGGEALSCFEIVFDAHTAARPARVAVSTSASSRGAGRGTKSRAGGGDRRPRRGPARDSRPTVPASTLRRRPWSEGRVFCWFSDRGRGVITSTTGQEFYVDRRFLAVGSELAAGDRVFFVPRDPVSRGRNPVAGAVLGDGARLEVRIEKPTEADAALAVVSDSNGTDQVLPLDIASVGPVKTGEWLLVQVTDGDGGPVGRPG